MSNKKYLEGYWDCEYCGRKGILGHIQKCPGCNMGRTANTIFYLDKTRLKYVSESEANKINKNPDWLCPYCSQLNPDSINICAYCGSERTHENKNYFELHPDVNHNKIESSNANSTNVQNSNTTNLEANGELEKTHNVSLEKEFDDNNSNWYLDSQLPKKEKSSSSSIPLFLKHILEFARSNFKSIAIGLSIILAIISIIIILIPKEQEITITGMEWNRSLVVEELRTFKEEGWELPAGARLLDSKTEFYGYDDHYFDHYEQKTYTRSESRVVGQNSEVVGYKDLGNGYFEEETKMVDITEMYTVTEITNEPVYVTTAIYKEKYYYEIDRWTYVNSVNTSGSSKSNPAPYWGEVTLGNKERKSQAIEVYTITGINSKNGKQQSFTLSFEDWNSVNVDDTVHLKTVLGHAELIDENASK